MRTLLTGITTPDRLERARSLAPALAALPAGLLPHLAPAEPFLTVGILTPDTLEALLARQPDAILLPENCGMGIINNLRSRTGAMLFRHITLRTPADLTLALAHGVDIPVIHAADPALTGQLNFPYILAADSPLPADARNLWAREIPLL